MIAAKILLCILAAVLVVILACILGPLVLITLSYIEDKLSNNN